MAVCVQPARPRRRTGVRLGAAFSLIELLVVVAIMGILAGLISVAFQNIGTGSAIVSGTAAVESQFSLALRQAASRNKTVQVRIYPDAKPPRISLVAGGVRLDRGVPLPQGLIFETDDRFSSLLGNDTTTGIEPADAPAALRQQSYFQFQVRPDGRTDLALAGEPWTLTLRWETAPARGDRPADNFATLLIDPLTAAVRTFQP